MTSANKAGLYVSRSAENHFRNRRKVKEGFIKSRLSHCVSVGGGSLYHMGKITARGFSLLNRVSGTTTGMVASVLTGFQSKKARKLASRQGLLLGSTVVHIVVTPVQVASFTAGSVLGFAKPKLGAKLMGLSVRVDRKFDTFDNAVQKVDPDKVIRKADDDRSPRCREPQPRLPYFSSDSSDNWSVDDDDFSSHTSESSFLDCNSSNVSSESDLSSGWD